MRSRRWFSGSVLLVLATLSTACSTTRAARAGRVGWLESLDRGSSLTTARKPAEFISNRGQSSRRGLLQQESGIHPVPFDAPELESVRMSRWGRVARSIRLSWPLKNVQVTSNFGIRGGDPHEGIDLRAPVGTPVYAAHDGVILYSGSGIRGYGKLVVVKNSAGISTVYGHNSRLLMRKGQRVRRGQRIALSGSTGRSSGPHVHFEVRLGLKPVDPRSFVGLPQDVAPTRRLTMRQRSTLAAAQRLR